MEKTTEKLVTIIGILYRCQPTGKLEEKLINEYRTTLGHLDKSKRWQDKIAYVRHSNALRAYYLYKGEQ